MAKSSLFLAVTCDTSDGRFFVETNIKDEHVPEIIAEFLRTQLGKGADARVPREGSICRIRLDLDLSEDRFSAKDDCGNLSLRDGILLDVVRRYGERSVQPIT
jgi:hypothetical protein